MQGECSVDEGCVSKMRRGWAWVRGRMLEKCSMHHQHRPFFSPVGPDFATGCMTSTNTYNAGTMCRTSSADQHDVSGNTRVGRLASKLMCMQ